MPRYTGSHTFPNQEFIGAAALGSLPDMTRMTGAREAFILMIEEIALGTLFRGRPAIKTLQAATAIVGSIDLGGLDTDKTADRLVELLDVVSMLNGLNLKTFHDCLINKPDWSFPVFR